MRFKFIKGKLIPLNPSLLLKSRRKKESLALGPSITGLFEAFIF